MTATISRERVAPSSSAARRRAALIAGVAYAVMFVLAIGANFGALAQIVVPDDPATTVANIAEHESAFRLGMAAFAVIAVLDIVIAWALHVLLRDLAPNRSLLAAWFRLAYGAIFAVAVGFMYVALVLATDPERFAGLDAGGREALAGLSMVGFDTIWHLALAVFGLHLIMIASIIVPARVAPRALGVVLALAGAAYIADTFARIVPPDYAAVADIMLVVVALPSMIGEMWFAGWLLLRASRSLAAKAPTPEAA